MIDVRYPGPSPALAARRLDNQAASAFLERALRALPSPRARANWTLHLQPAAIFNRAGILAVLEALADYRGQASHLRIELDLPLQAWRDYYSLQSELRREDPAQARGTIELPMRAERRAGDGSTDTLVVALRWIETPLRFPASLAEPSSNVTPTALLMVHGCDHDLLFANQVLAFSELARDLSRSPWTWLAAGFRRLPGNWRKRIPRAYRSIHASAQIHPTAVIEGSTIGPGCRVGAHCVVRFSRVGAQVQIHDGAKVEYSVVDDHSWLMHDLVLYRCHVEPEVFLIHGPYQFSCFQQGSAAFATIMMDYRPDGRPIRVMTPGGVRPYAGGFLGALLEEKSKALGGSLLAPGTIVPRETSVGPAREQVLGPRLLPASPVASIRASATP